MASLSFSPALLGALLLVILSSPTDGQQCHWKEVGDCADRSLTVTDNTILPNTEADLQADCQYALGIRDCMTNYTRRCMSPTSLEVMGLMLESMSSPIVEICTPGSTRGRDFLRHNTCKNRAYTEKNRDCIKELVVATEKSLDASTPHRDRMATFCCGMKRLFTCLDEVVEPVCGAAARDFTAQLFIDMSLGSARVGCTPFPDDQCPGLLPPSGTEPASPINGFATIVQAASPLWT